MIPRSHVVAQHYFSEKIKANPSNARYHRNIVPLLQEQGNQRQALKHLKAAVEFNPMDCDARSDYALVLFKNGRLDQATQEFLTVLNIKPKHICAVKNISAVYARRGQYKKAIEYADQAVKLDPSDPQAHRNLAKLYDIMGNTRDAVQHNQSALKFGPGVRHQREAADTDTYRRLAVQLVSRGKLQTGHVQDHFDAHLALAGKRKISETTQRTHEILMKTGSFGKR